MSLDNEEEIMNRLTSDLLLYLTHYEKNYNEIQESEEKSIIEVNEFLFYVFYM